MAKKDNTIWVLVAIAALIIFLNIQAEPEQLGIKPHYYKDGVEVFPETAFPQQRGLFSIVTPPGGSYNQISFDIYGSNTGNVDIYNMQIVDASPQVFKDVLPSTTQSLLLGETNKLLWSSGTIEVEQFESYSQPVRFWVNFSGEFSTVVEPIYQESFVDLSFEEEVSTVMFISPTENEIVSGITTISWEGSAASFPLAYLIQMSGSCSDFNDVDLLKSSVSLFEGNYEWDTTAISNGEYCIMLIKNPVEYATVLVIVENEPPKLDGIYTGEHWDTAISGNTNPRGITTDGNYFLIVDNNNNVYKYNMNGNYISNWGLDDDNDYPISITTDGNNVWVVDANYKAYKYDMNGNYINNWFINVQNMYVGVKPFAITTDGTNIWSSDIILGNDIKKYSMSGGLISDWDLNSENTGAGEMAVEGGYMWVTDQFDAEVYIYDKDGVYTGEHWDTSTSGNTVPYGITVNENYIWITDYTKAEVYKYELQ